MSFVQLHDLLSIQNLACIRILLYNNDIFSVVKRSSTEYDAGQAVKALFERSNTLTAVAVVSTGPIGVTPPCVPAEQPERGATST